MRTRRGFKSLLSNSASTKERELKRVKQSREPLRTTERIQTANELLNRVKSLNIKSKGLALFGSRKNKKLRRKLRAETEKVKADYKKWLQGANKGYAKTLDSLISVTKIKSQLVMENQVLREINNEIIQINNNLK